MATVRERLEAGERVKVRGKPGGGFVYMDRYGEFQYEVHEGWAEGVTEAICHRTSTYLEEHFLKSLPAVN